ncbi:MAG: lasso peptide biosynthesis B2 protein [Alphaproteobacteria bacterium]
MRLGRRIASFLRAPARRKALALEAMGELARACLVTLLPARIYTRDFGSVALTPDAAVDAVCPKAASDVGRMVEVVAQVMPFRALCLQQAVAARRMLHRRGLRATVYLGVKRNAADRKLAGQGGAAHAWVEVGSQVVNGDTNLGDYAVVGRFV